MLFGTARSALLINGAGATFPYPIYSKWFDEYTKVDSSVHFNYQSIGSGGGIKMLQNQTVDFGASDAPMNEEQLKASPSPVLHFPSVMGAVVLAYNLPEVKSPIRLTGPVIADIFLGNIVKWTDPAIAKLNPGVPFPDEPIVTAHRSDGSGTTNIFTSYFSLISADWADKVGRGSSVNWPAGLGGKGNEGVAGLIRQTHGAIGYIELAFAMQNKMAFGKIQNRAGHFVTPSIASISAAAAIRIPADGKASLANTDAPDGYPISSFSWVLIYKEQKYGNRSLDRATKMLKLLSWMIHDGQQFSGALNYAPLSPAAVSVGDAILKSATYDGKPILQ